MEDMLRNLGFVHVGHIAVNDAGDKPIFVLLPEYTSGGPHANICGWVYLWVQVDPQIEQFDIVYVGKAGNTLGNRFAQHVSGFRNSSTGRRHSTRIMTYFTALPRNSQLAVYARKSVDATILGEPRISMCEAEERAMITLCLRQGLRLWNYEARPPRDVRPAQPLQPDEPAAAQVVEISLQQERDEDDAEAPGALSREDTFWASLSAYPIAEATIARLLAALNQRGDAEVHYTFTDGADLRVRKLTQNGRAPIVSRVWWRSRSDGRQGFGATLYLTPEAALAAGASEVRDPYNGQPANVRSHAFFEVPGEPGALITAVEGSLDAFGEP